MKFFVIDEDKFVIYYSLILDDILEYEIEDIKLFIKMLVLKLREKYHLDIKGYYHLDVHVKKILILEFERIDEYENEVDLNIVIHVNTPIMLKFKDYFLMDEEKYFYKDYYYVSIDKVDFVKYIEFCEFIYGKDALEVVNFADVVS